MLTVLSTTSMHFEWDPIEENTFRLAYKRYTAMKFRIYTSSITRYAYAIAHGEHGAMFDIFLSSMVTLKRCMRKNAEKGIDQW